jgi:hypothetical protein
VVSPIIALGAVETLLWGAVGSNMTGVRLLAIGEDSFFWSSDQAIMEAERRDCSFCG